MSRASIVGIVFVGFANGCAVTKTGPFAWDGGLGYYVPMAVWGVWLNAHAFLIRRDILRRRDQGAAPPSVAYEELEVAAG